MLNNFNQFILVVLQCFQYDGTTLCVLDQINELLKYGKPYQNVLNSISISTRSRNLAKSVLNSMVMTFEILFYPWIRIVCVNLLMRYTSMNVDVDRSHPDPLCSKV